MYLCLFTALRQDRIISSQKVRHVQTAVTGVFFAASVFNSIQYFLNAEGQNNAITMWTKPMKRNWCRKQDSQRKRPGEVEHYWKFLVWIQLVFFDAMIGSKNHTICKIHVSDIDLSNGLSWEQPISHYTMCNHGFRVIGDDKIVL